MDQPVPTNWWQRNWKWFVPVGCLSMVMMALLFVGIIVLFFFLGISLIKSNGAYQQALAKARHDPAVIAALGQPIQDGWLVNGDLTDNGSYGQAEYTIPLSGPHGTGHLYFKASKSAGQWTYSKLIVDVEATQDRIDLLNANP